MSTISIHRTHTLGKEGATAAVNDIARQLSTRLQVNSRWNGDTLEFSRPGADGSIQVSDSDVDVHVKLGLMLSPMKGVIEDQITSYLDQNLH